MNPSSAPGTTPRPAPEAWRPFFLIAAVAGLAALLVWAGVLSGRLSVPPSEHASVMIWGVYGAAVLGFLLTAYPKQNNAPAPRPALLGALLLLHLGTLLGLIAGWAGAPTGAWSTVFGAATWLTMVGFTARIAVTSLRARWDGTTLAVPIALLAALMGWLSIRATSLPGLSKWVVPAGLDTSRLGLDLGIHGFLVLLSMGLLDRLLPFFSGRVIAGYDGVRRPGFVGLLMLSVALRTGLSAPGAPSVIGDLAIAAVLIRQWTGWRPWSGVRVPMIAVLHLGIAWVILGYLLEAAGLATGSLPAHLWMVGGLGTLLMGISIRVSLGHSGQLLRLGWGGVLVVGLVQVAVGLRAVLPLFGVSPSLVPAALVLAAAFLVWLGVFGPYAARGR